MALAAGDAHGGNREVFFVYDAQTRKFATHSGDQSLPHLHEDILIVKDDIYFASCKTTTPVGRLNLTTGQVTMFGNPEPQAGLFYLDGLDVYVKDTDHTAYRVDGNELIKVNRVISENQITRMSFDAILRKSSEPDDALAKR